MPYTRAAGYDCRTSLRRPQLPQPLTIALTVRFDEAGLDAIRAVDPRIELINLAEHFGAAMPEGEAKATVLAGLRSAEVIAGSNRLTTEYFDAAPNLRWLQVMNAGLERLHRQGVLQRGFMVTNGSGLAAAPIAEWCIGAMFALAKRFPGYVQHQGRHEWLRIRGATAIEGKTCGIVGLGAIGRATAVRARALGMRVVASRRTVEGSDPDCDELIPYSRLHDLLAQSDFVVLCVPLTDETTGLIDDAALRAMKPTAHILNIARGPVIDQDALIAALREGRLAGAALDVTTPEPLNPESALWDLPNVLITPHTSGSSDRRDGTAAALFVENLKRYIKGEKLLNLARPDLGY
jgi:phosphoglycerate dehydrogenase-like enzyme